LLRRSQSLKGMPYPMRSLRWRRAAARKIMTQVSEHVRFYMFVVNSIRPEWIMSDSKRSPWRSGFVWK
jgi:hypothetical protein